MSFDLKNIRIDRVAKQTPRMVYLYTLAKTISMYYSLGTKSFWRRQLGLRLPESYWVNIDASSINDAVGIEIIDSMVFMGFREEEFREIIREARKSLEKKNCPEKLIHRFTMKIWAYYTIAMDKNRGLS